MGRGSRVNVLREGQAGLEAKAHNTTNTLPVQEIFRPFMVNGRLWSRQSHGPYYNMLLPVLRACSLMVGFEYDNMLSCKDRMHRVQNVKRKT